MTPVDTTAQCRAEADWQSASVVNYTIVTHPTIRQPDFDLPRQSRTVFGKVKAHAVQFFTNGALPNHRHATVASSRL